MTKTYSEIALTNMPPDYATCPYVHATEPTEPDQTVAKEQSSLHQPMISSLPEAVLEMKTS